MRRSCRPFLGSEFCSAVAPPRRAGDEMRNAANATLDERSLADEPLPTTCSEGVQLDCMILASSPEQERKLYVTQANDSEPRSLSE